MSTNSSWVNPARAIPSAKPPVPVKSSTDRRIVIKELPQAPREPSEIAKFALPRDQSPPSLTPCFGLDRQIATAIAVQFRKPELPTRLGQPGVPTPGMSVPEASVHPDHPAPPGKCDVRSSGHPPVLEAVPVSKVGEQAS